MLPTLSATDFVGASVCGSCHPSQYRTQSTSHHARALLPINDSPLPAQLMERPLRERDGVAYEYVVVEDGLRVQVRKYNTSIAGLLEWAFGAGVQGLTAVGRVDGEYFEHRVSYYPARGKPAITIGHPLEPPKTPREGLGMRQDARTITNCFRCHATGVAETADARPQFDTMQPGIRCERCHGRGSAHVQAKGLPEKGQAISIENPGRRSAKGIIDMCGECHRLPEPRTISARPEQDDPFNVRFQPMGLLASRCFSESQALSCVTCHDPHEDVRKEHDYYVTKCLGCHEAGEDPPIDCRRRETENCLPCHMPQASPSPFLYFTDHRIRVK